jgi:putative tryptophan/tyrosine transport system substrate-binding protein
MRRREVLGLVGGAAAWPLAARGQQSLPAVGFLSSRSPEESAHLVEAFRGGLKDGGFIEGQSVSLEFRWARGDYGRLPALAAELVNRRVSVIAAVGGDPSNKAAKQATATIPIVFATGSDPVQAGLVESFNRPGGNATGVTTSTNLMEPKRVGLLRELAPGVSLVGALVNPNFPAAVRQAADIEQAARTVGQRILIANASTDDELEAAFASFVRGGVGALLVTADPYFDVRRDRIVAFAARQRLPAIYQFREFAVAGGILSYGPDKFASCEPLAERRTQPITGIRQHAAKAHTRRDGTIDLRQSHLRFRSCRSIFGRNTRSLQPSPALGGEAEILCSTRALPVLTQTRPSLW